MARFMYAMAIIKGSSYTTGNIASRTANQRYEVIYKKKFYLLMICSTYDFGSVELASFLLLNWKYTQIVSVFLQIDSNCV